MGQQNVQAEEVYSNVFVSLRMANVLFGEWGDNKNVKRNELTGEGRRDCVLKTSLIQVYSCILPNDRERLITQNIQKILQGSTFNFFEPK